MNKHRNPKQALLDGPPASAGQCLKDKAPHLTVKSSVTGPNFPGHAVPEGYRGTEYAPRNPMHDQEPMEQESGRSDPIRQQHKLKGVR